MSDYQDGIEATLLEHWACRSTVSSIINTVGKQVWSAQFSCGIASSIEEGEDYTSARIKHLASAVAKHTRPEENSYGDEADVFDRKVAAQDGGLYDPA